MTRQTPTLTLIAAAALAWGTAPAAFGYDSGSKALGPTVGATDYYRLSCSADNGTPHHLSLKIMDATPLPEGTSQLLNFHVSKDEATAEATAVKPAETRELSLQGGNGKYTVAVDTEGTNLGITTAQRYKLGFQCVNATGDKTRVSAKKKSGRLKNGKVRQYRVKCNRTKAAGNADRLLIQITDTTPPQRSPQILNAQISRGLAALNVTDRNGDEDYSPEIQLNGGAGDYRMTVDNTGADASKDNSRIYSFQAACLDKQGTATAEPTVQVIQDQ